jgi:ELWxxDGT repeat protein
MVTDINPDGRSDAAQLTVVGDSLFSSARDGVHITELWGSDGTAAGTKMVKDLSPWHSYPKELTAVGSTLFFQAIDETYGKNQRRLFVSDGTAAGTHSVAADTTYDPQWMTALGDQVIYSDSVSLWRSDGTDAGTVKLGPGLEPRELLRSGDAVYFNANGVDLWRTDGTAEGTSFVAKSYPRDMADFDGVLYFSGFDQTNKQELWHSDGTPDGTALLADCGPGWAAPKLLVSALP